MSVYTFYISLMGLIMIQLSCLPVSVQVQAAAVQNVSMQIIGIRKADGLQFKLDVTINDQLNTFIASSRLLAKAFGVKLDGNMEERLLQKIPFSAEAEIKGNQIQDLKAAKEM